MPSVSGTRRADTFVWLPENLMIPLDYLQWLQLATAARATRAMSRIRFIQRAVRGAHQIQATRLEKLALGPVEFHRYMRTAVQVRVRLLAVAHNECACVLTAGGYRKSNALAAIRQCISSANKDFGTHACSVSQ